MLFEPDRLLLTEQQKLRIDHIAFPGNYVESDHRVNELVSTFVDGLAKFSRAHVVSTAIPDVWDDTKPDSIAYGFDEYFGKVSAIR